MAAEPRYSASGWGFDCQGLSVSEDLEFNAHVGRMYRGGLSIRSVQ